jgi:hypothetical protein
LRWSKRLTWRRVGEDEWEKGYEAVLNVAKFVQRGVAREIPHKYGSDTQSRCPYQGNSGEREKRRYGHRLPLLIPQKAQPVKLLGSLCVKKK